MHDTGNTADIASAAALLWQVVRSNEACMRHHECQKTWHLLLSSLLKLQQLQSRLPLPTQATFNGDILRHNRERLNQEEDSNRGSSQHDLVNTPTVEHLTNTDQNGSHNRQLHRSHPGPLEAGEWVDALQFRQDISKSSTEEALNGI